MVVEVVALTSTLIHLALFGATLAVALLYHGSNPIFLWLSWLPLVVSFTIATYKHKVIEIPRSSTLMWIGIFFLWLTTTIIWSPMPHGSWETFWTLALLPAGIIFVLINRYSALTWDQLWLVAAITALALAHYALLQYFQGDPPRSIFLNKNNLAAFLNLFIISACAYFLLVRNRAYHFSLGYFILISVLVVFLIGSRGAILGLMAGISLLVFAAALHKSWQRLLVVFMLFTAAIITANVLADNASTLRMASLGSPGEAGSTRFLIWQSTLELIGSQPWLGSGLGSFFHLYPSVRQPTEASGGYYVHNDLLQIWLEAGLPALLLILVILFMMTRTFLPAVSSLKNKYVHISLMGIIGALLSVSLHSLFTFNFYIPAILLIVGMLIARSLILAEELTVPTPSLTLNTQKYRSLPLLISIAACYYFGSFALSSYYYVQAARMAHEGDLLKTSRLLDRSQRLAPNDEIITLARADLLKEALLNSPDTDDNILQRSETLHQASTLYHQAMVLNPYRSDPWKGIALLEWKLYKNSDKHAIINHFQRALVLNPRELDTRISYAKFMRENYGLESGLNVLESGLDQAYPSILPTVIYYDLLETYYIESRQTDKALLMQERSNQIKHTILRHAKIREMAPVLESTH